VATDAIGSAAIATIMKAGGAVVKIGGKYYKKLNGKVVEVPDYYVRPNGEVIPSTGYRAVSGPGAEAAKKGDLMSSNGDTYFTFDNPAGKSAAQIKSELQIPHEPTHYGEFDTIQIIDDVRIPNENWGQGTKPEPITDYFGPNNPDPTQNFGKGGATQAVTKTPIKDFELQEIGE
jgi:hypothetical protein